ncbi:substrate-binding periplasmic protein [Pseudomonas sp. SC11]|uniref:substrate-binding periplasmic protein n=1 Tax=Pseudomonas sp. SC11 TaxID=326927 RepID=UPI00399958AF
MSAFNRLVCLLLLACLSPLAKAERLRLVSDDWAPYIYRQYGRPAGIDHEVVSEVFKRLGIEVDWQFLPWKRCLAMVEQGLADGIMDTFHVGERESYLIYASEPLSTVEFVLYQANARPHPVQRLDDLAGLRIGTSPGYTYGNALDDSTRLHREDAPTHEANFGKLMLGRIDLLITDRRAGRYLRQQLGLQDSVRELPLVIERQPQFLGLARKPGREALAKAFSEELQRFKQEPAYAALAARYTQAAEDFLDTVEQHDRSTPR